jgi:precorrin-6A/cobalt-precorrin-6A reductase
MTSDTAFSLRVLILGGTTEASALARLVADQPAIAATLSFAGRTENPVPPPIPYRIGGFGGAEGLARHLRAARIAAVVDATHPYAVRISANAVAACAAVGVPLAVLTRAPWDPVAGDRWTVVDDAPAAARALGPAPRRVFLTLGRLELDAFAAAPQHHYLVRTVDAPDPPPALPRMTQIQARGPFDEAGERDLLLRERIDVLVTKNSGGSATYAKIAAARAMGLPVVLIRRPTANPSANAGGTMLHDPAAALAWLMAHHSATTLRGV